MRSRYVDYNFSGVINLLRQDLSEYNLEVNWDFNINSYREEDAKVYLIVKKFTTPAHGMYIKIDFDVYIYSTFEYTTSKIMWSDLVNSNKFQITRWPEAWTPLTGAELGVKGYKLLKSEIQIRYNPE